jgi:hypothetical protein
MVSLSIDLCDCCAYFSDWKSVRFIQKISSSGMAVHRGDV